VIADDSPEMRWLVRTAIGNDFTDVIEVGDGRELLWTLLRAEFAGSPEHPADSIVVTDLHMPGYDGLAVLDAWHDLAPNAPTIVITAFPSAAVHAAAERVGAFVLPKPFSTATLSWLVREMLAGRRNG